MEKQPYIYISSQLQLFEIYKLKLTLLVYETLLGQSNTHIGGIPGSPLYEMLIK